MTADVVSPKNNWAEIITKHVAETEQKVVLVKEAADKSMVEAEQKAVAAREIADRLTAETAHTVEMLHAFVEFVEQLSTYGDADEPKKYNCFYGYYKSEQLEKGYLSTDKFKDILALGKKVWPTMFTWEPLPTLKLKHPMAWAFVPELPRPLIACVVLKRDVSITKLRGERIRYTKGKKFYGRGVIVPAGYKGPY